MMGKVYQYGSSLVLINSLGFITDESLNAVINGYWSPVY